MAGFDDRADARAEAADVRAQRAAGRRRDREHQRAYKAGIERGRNQQRRVLPSAPPQAHSDGELQSSYEVGFREGQQSQPHPIGQHLAPALSGAREHSNELAGFVLALVGWAVFVNYAHGGTAGVRAWVKAKFFNQPGAANTAKSQTPASPESPAVPLAVTRVQPGATSQGTN